MDELTDAGLAGLIGVVVSFLLANLPWLDKKWKSVGHKREVIFGVFLVAPFIVLGGACNNIYFQYACPPGAFIELNFYVKNIVLGAIAFAGSQWGFKNGAETLQKE